MGNLVIKVLVSLLAIGLLISRWIWPELKVDAITVGLFVAALLPWLTSIIESFKTPGGWEVRLRKEMKQVVDEANATLDQLRSVACISTEAILTDLMASNFMDGTTLRKKLEIHNRLIANLEKLRATKEQIQKADEMWSRGVPVIFFRGIRKAIESRESNTHDEKERLKEVSHRYQDLMEFDEWKVPSSQDLREFLSIHHALNPDVEELLVDLAEFENEGSLRREEVFVKL